MQLDLRGRVPPSAQGVDVRHVGPGADSHAVDEILAAAVENIAHFQDVLAVFLHLVEQHRVGLEAEVVDELEPLAGRIGKGQAGVQPTGHGPIAIGLQGLRLALADQSLSGLDREPPVAPVRPALERGDREDWPLMIAGKEGTPTASVFSAFACMAAVSATSSTLKRTREDRPAEVTSRRSCSPSSASGAIVTEMRTASAGRILVLIQGRGGFAAWPGFGLALGSGFSSGTTRALSPLPESQTAEAPLSCWPATVASTVLPNCPPAREDEKYHRSGGLLGTTSGSRQQAKRKPPQG